ncbi:MAG TPA: hypothetical protein VM864_04895 [Pyrinomonadaceae bacterium]|nr:hypothetical protein [Pyrinomonadaceae bacterium]
MKQVLRLPFFALALCLLCAAAAGRVSAQTATPTPDPFVTQITSSAGDTFARDISGDGRFVVIESSGNIATAAPAGQTVPSNADGNREIFLFDFAQRRIFQITDTKSALKSATVAEADRFKNDNILVEVSNNRPAISRDGKWIVFSSNGFNQNDAGSGPFSFDGDVQANEDALKLDGNQELFLYRVPDVAAASLTSGELPEFTNLRQNAFTRVTNTTASRLPRPGLGNAPPTAAPFVADDNRDASINDDGSRVAFVSTRNLAGNLGAANSDGSPEIYVYNNSGTPSFTQLTVTSLEQNLFVFTDNPSISGATSGASVIAFVSNATDLRTETGSNAANAASGNADGNAEIFVATYNGTTATAMKQATRTKRKIVGDTVNFLNPGRRISRDGSLVVFESVAADPKGDNSATNDSNRAVFVYNVAADTFTQVAARALSTGTDAEFEDVLRFPTFARADSTRVYFTSDLNLKSDGSRVNISDTAGLNPLRIKQIFSATVPASSSGATLVTRLTNLTGADPGNTMEAYVSDTQERIAFSLANFEFGTGNPDRANEAYYLITPPAPLASDAPAASSALQFLTGASRREVATPAASPSPVPTPAAGVVTGLAPGMIGFVRTTSTAPATLAPSEKRVCPADNPGCDAASESQHRPNLPVELNGVSLSVNGAAAGLYFVSPTEVQFVVPPALAAQTAAATYPVVITVRGGATVRTVRTVLQVVAAQPDIFTTTNGAGGRAAVTNVTNPLLATGTPEPFSVKTTFTNSSGQTVTAQTVLRVVLTGVRDPLKSPAAGLARSSFTVRIGTTDLTGEAIPRDAQPTDTPGVFTLDFVLPDSLAGAGDVPIIITFASGGVTSTSRPADTAPRIRINN